MIALQCPAERVFLGTYSKETYKFNFFAVVIIFFVMQIASWLF